MQVIIIKSVCIYSCVRKLMVVEEAPSSDQVNSVNSVVLVWNLVLLYTPNCVHGMYNPKEVSSCIQYA